jgi:4-amino-4-deoxy-L-arabinose transferase-like glycosyltransferase
MSSTISKKRNKSKKKTLPKKTSENRQAGLNNSVITEKAASYVLNGLLLIYLFYYLFQLYTSLDNTFFWADENKHAYICSVVLKTQGIPTVLPEEMYGEFQWSYPPLFHIIGATVQGTAGLAAIKYTNLIILITFFMSFYLLLLRYYSNTEALIACLLISFAPVVAINTVRFTTEMLSMLLTFLSFFFFLLALRETKTHFAVLAGISTGLLMLSKQTGLIVVSFYVLLLPWFLWKNTKKFKLMLYVIVVSLIIYAPYLIWTASNETGVLGFINLFMAKRPDWALLGAKSFRRFDSGLKEFVFLLHKGTGWIVIFSLLLPLYYFIRSRLKDTAAVYVLLLAVYLAAAMVVWHITNKRHVITLMPFIAFLFSYSLHRVLQKRLFRQGALILLLIIAGYFAYHLPDYRQKYNTNGTEFKLIAETIKEDHSFSGRILGVNKFDILMYTQKPVIWPHPKLSSNPLDLFEKQSPDLLYSRLKNYHVRYIVINIQFVRNTDVFFGRNYPISFARNLEQLERKGKLVLEAISESKKFILLRVL